MSVKKFVEIITKSEPTVTDRRLIVYLDSMIYPNEFGIGVRPLQVKYGSSIIDMKKLIDIFDKIPYITVKESRYRSVYREPMIMTINLDPRVFEDKTYYDYYIDKLCLRNELKRYESIYHKAREVIKEFKRNSQSVEDFRKIDDEEVA